MEKVWKMTFDLFPVYHNPVFQLCDMQSLMKKIDTFFFNILYLT